ncbi:hypothetical protein D777_02509 [Marinobacter nitratireducens]|uniref:Uncharacterized protein n=1 Tax=Marinobacter nitratireducens TaxID=1137280 RepID=A0A072N014_9GAMM|nr:hypothetical protein D777_02509 [Marinobacter nitratireducens]
MASKSASRATISSQSRCGVDKLQWDAVCCYRYVSPVVALPQSTQNLHQA